MRLKIYFMMFLCMLVSMAHATTFVVDGVIYTVLDDGYSVAVTKVSSQRSDELVLPAEVTYNGLPYTVTTIGEDCFSYKKCPFTSVVLPNTIKKIEKEAFRSCQLKSFTFPESLESIGDYAFYSSDIESVTIPESVRSIGHDAFGSCSNLVSVELNEGVSSIGDEAFGYCKKLTSISLPRSINVLSSGMFMNCASLQEITIPNTITSFSTTKPESTRPNKYGVFEGCTNLSKVIFEDGNRPLAYKLDHSFKDCPIKEVYYGREITGDVSFRGFATIEKLTLGENVRTLPGYCFQECSGLTEVTIPDGVVSIGYFCFSSCHGLKTVYVGNGLQVLMNGVFGYCENLEKAYIGNGLRTLNGFVGDTSLRMICITSNQIAEFKTGESTPSIPMTVSMIYVPDKEMCAGLLGAYNLKSIVTEASGESVYNGVGVNVDMLTSVPDATVRLTSVEGVDVPVNVGAYNASLPVQLSVGEWKSSFNTNCTFTIKPAPLTIIANSLSREYGAENPECTCSYVGFVNGETEDVLTAKPTVLCSATKDSPAGQYPLIPSAASARNYDITYERGVLTVTQASQQIEWNQDISKLHVGDIIELDAESSAGLKVSFSSSNPAVADVYSSGGKTYMECMAPGAARITAYQAGNANYFAADDLVKRVTVELADGVNDVAGNEADVTYYTLDGTKVLCPTKGIYIARYGSGKMRKVIIK